MANYDTKAMKRHVVLALKEVDGARIEAEAGHGQRLESRVKMDWEAPLGQARDHLWRALDALRAHEERGA